MPSAHHRNESGDNVGDNDEPLDEKDYSYSRTRKQLLILGRSQGYSDSYVTISHS